MFLEMILKGLSWGVFFVSVLVPICAFSVAWSHLGPILKKRKDEELELLTTFSKKISKKSHLFQTTKKYPQIQIYSEHNCETASGGSERGYRK